MEKYDGRNNRGAIKAKFVYKTKLIHAVDA